MKLKFIFGIFVLLFSIENIKAQTIDYAPEEQRIDTLSNKSESFKERIFINLVELPVDTTIAKKGDLLRFIKDSYRSAMLYYFGGTGKLYITENKPVILLYEKDEKDGKYITLEDLETIDMDSIVAINIECGVFNTAIYGTRGIPCIFKIRLKDKTE
jgi:hypothetical protein